MVESTKHNLIKRKAVKKEVPLHDRAYWVKHVLKSEGRGRPSFNDAERELILKSFFVYVEEGKLPPRPVITQYIKTKDDLDFLKNRHGKVQEQVVGALKNLISKRNKYA